jgi:hypothetical protein
MSQILSTLELHFLVPKMTAPLSLIQNSFLQPSDQSPCRHKKKNLPAGSTSQSPLQTFAASSSQSQTEQLLPQTGEDLLNRTPKQCNSHELARALTESSRQQPAASYKKCSLQAMLNKLPPVPHEAEPRLTIRKRSSEGSVILTSSPFKINLEEKDRQW